MADNFSSSGSTNEETPQEIYERLAYEWSSLSDRVMLSNLSFVWQTIADKAGAKFKAGLLGCRA